jgi:hypothetical protein
MAIERIWYAHGNQQKGRRNVAKAKDRPTGIARRLAAKRRRQSIVDDVLKALQQTGDDDTPARKRRSQKTTSPRRKISLGEKLMGIVEELEEEDD